MNLKIIHTKNLRWIDIVNPGEKEIQYLRQNFQFQPNHYKDIGLTQERTKIEIGTDYHFIVLLFPIYLRKSKEINPSEVDFFVGPGYVITIHDGTLETMGEVFAQMQLDEDTRREYMSKNAGYLLYYIMESLFKRSYPMLDHITKDMNSIEKRIFSDMSLEILEEISLMKRNIIDFRRTMKTHYLIIKKLLNNKDPYMIFHGSKQNYSGLMEHTENIWDILAIQKETIEALHDANQSLAANRLNAITKLMTTLSAVFLPATLVLFAFGITNTKVPFAHDTWGFFIVMGLAGLSSLLMTLFIYFKLKRML